MDQLAKQLIELTDQGRVVSFHGRSEPEVNVAIDDLANHPFGPDVFVGLCRSGDADDLDAALKIVDRTSNPAVMGEIVRECVAVLPLTSAISERLHEIMIRRSADRNGHWSLRSQALLGASLLSRSKPVLGYKLVVSLLGAATDDDAHYLKYVAKIAGVTNAALTVPDLQAMLVRLSECPTSRNEAVMELGLIELKKGLESRERDAAIVAFTKARDFFVAACVSSELRVDAQLYRLSLDLLLNFQDGRRSGPAGAEVEKICQAAFEYCAHATPADSRVEHTWLTDRAGEAMGWSTLALRLKLLEQSLGETLWLEAAVVIERQLLVCYSASRSILRRNEDGGLEEILRPPISDAIQEEQARLQALDLWIDRYAGSEMILDAKTLRREASSAREAAVLRNPIEATSTDPVAAILREGLVTPSGRSAALEEVAAGVSQVIVTSTPLVVRRKLDEMACALQTNPDFSENQNARALFFSILFRTLAWQYEIENAERGKRPFSDYLFSSNAIEADLQRDYLATVQAGSGGGGVRSEARAIAHGRADVAFDMGLITIVAELKKSNRARTLEELLDHFGLQATAYQRSNVRLGLLIVLDLTDRGGTGEHFDVSSQILEKVPQGTSTAYSIAVVRIQGRKRTPSAVKKQRVRNSNTLREK
ncbi:hypothetical protein [Novosphingobium kaempferiae]|uniref:hypothetical protein n=1 Tax=Novosphingobium kaempferiae TaxID=2896849 RepID=UPI001E392B80|nr:hypothetical protein [Novosphingobium kaempferiae]